MPHARAPPPPPPVGPSKAVASASGRAWPVFCHLIHKIMGVTPFDGGGELIASVTVLSASVSPSPGILRCLAPFSSQPYICSPPSVQISVFRNRSREKPHLSSILASPSRTSARTEQRESRRLRNPRPLKNLAWGVWRLGFWGTIRDYSSTYVFFQVVISRSWNPSSSR